MRSGPKSRHGDRDRCAGRGWPLPRSWLGREFRGQGYGPDSEAGGAGMSDTIEQHQEQPSVSEGSLEPADGCCPIAVAAPERVRGRPFPPGVSGNPAGRLPGTRNRATMAAEALLDGEAQALTRKAIELALAGDTVALRLCLERIMPARKSRTLKLKMPSME